jgi:tetratricopeptide (TPR) repeat protein
LTSTLVRLLALAVLVTACGNTGGSGRVERNTPFGVDRRGEAVDGLLVGHRLMEAGEHELALKAYLRAAAEDGINADVLAALGSANLKLGRLGQAEQLLRRALEMDGSNVPALNKAQDSGQSDSIRENLRLAIAKSEDALYDDTAETGSFSLVRREKGRYVLLTQL